MMSGELGQRLAAARRTRESAPQERATAVLRQPAVSIHLPPCERTGFAANPPSTPSIQGRVRLLGAWATNSPLRGIDRGIPRMI